MQRSQPKFATLLAVGLSCYWITSTIGQAPPQFKTGTTQTHATQTHATQTHATQTQPIQTFPERPRQPQDAPSLPPPMHQTVLAPKNIPAQPRPAPKGNNPFANPGPRSANAQPDEFPSQATQPESGVAFTGEGQQPSRIPPVAKAPNGNRLLADAVRHIAQHRSIVANIRHRIHLFGHELIGSGTYQQMDIGQDRLLRLELKIPLDEQITSITQICDARFLYLQRTMPDKNGHPHTTIGRVDLNKVRRTAANELGGSGLRHDGLLLGQGGLPQLMIELGQHFDFYEVRSAVWNDVPVWITWGQWKPDVLLQLFPELSVEGASPSLSSLPAHVPHTATVVLGREDLLPYQFEYRRLKGPIESQASLTLLDNAQTDPILTMELYAVEVGGVIDPSQFTFHYSDRDHSADPATEAKLTNEYLQRARKWKMEYGSD